MTRSTRIKLTLVPLTDAAAFQRRCLLAEKEEPGLTLGQLLAEMPALSTTPIRPELAEVQVARLAVDVVPPTTERPLFWPDGMVFGAVTTAVTTDEPGPAVVATGGGAKPGRLHPREVKPETAVLLAHDEEIAKVAKYLAGGLSVLVRCDKLLVEHLAREMALRSSRTTRVIEARNDGKAADLGPAAPGRRQELLAAIQFAVRNSTGQDLVVVPHLDLLAGGTDAALTAEARELIDVLYDRSKCVLLAFVDPSLIVPEVLANRFAVRIAVDILPREVRTREGERVPIGRALVSAEEAELFSGFDEVALYKHVAGMNAVRLRHAMDFAKQEHAHKPSTFADLLAELRSFKAATSSTFELPNVSFDDIGGYPAVRAELLRALKIIAGADTVPDRFRNELVPRGFIFHGPPGTGKTLFAKAVATKLDATIMVVAGPEVTDMYVGESERKVREIFAEARRNAPAVVVFDEFDSIASRRSGRDDGGSRAGNAVVAQLLTEMDGFRPEVPVLIIGTTNRLDIIDEALLRPSRFRPIRIDLPDESARREIAKVHAQHFDVKVSDDLLDRIARATSRMNGDEIRSLFRDARADELIGDPPRPADARRLGELVGLLRRAAQDRDLDRAQRSGPRPLGQRNPDLVPLTPPAPTAPPASDAATPTARENL